MKLKFFNTTNSNKRSPQTPKISISKAGSFSFNSKACEMMSIKKDSAMQIAQDEDRPKDWYVVLNSGPESFVLRDYKNGTFLFSSASTAQKMRESIAADGSISMIIGSEPIAIEGTVLWPLITSSVNKK